MTTKSIIVLVISVFILAILIGCSVIGAGVIASTIALYVWVMIFVGKMNDDKP